MKKLLVLFFILAFAAVAFAQTTYVVTKNADGKYVVRVIETDANGNPMSLVTYTVASTEDIDSKISKLEQIKAEIEAYIAAQPPEEPPQ